MRLTIEFRAFGEDTSWRRLIEAITDVILRAKNESREKLSEDRSNF